ncbi:hypothetical protein ACWDR9_35875, partial [Streptosporangium sandarakinum]
MTNVVTGRSAGIRRGLLIAAAGTLIMGVGMTVVRDAAWILGAGVAVLVVGCVQAAMAARGRAGTRRRTSPAWIGGADLYGRPLRDRLKEIGYTIDRNSSWAQPG